MRGVTVLFTILGFVALSSAAAAEDARLAASRDIAMSMQSALKGELMQAMASAGPVGAIAVAIIDDSRVLKTSPTAAQNAITTYRNIDIQAAGTWIKMIR